MATVAFRLPLSPSFDGTGLRSVIDVPLVARQATQSRAATRHALGLPANRRLVLLSFGGYGLNDLDVAKADCAADWDIVATDRSVAAPHIRALPFVHSIAEDALASVRYENLVAAVDAVITKPGYGIISECTTAGTPMLYTSRGAFREYDVLVEEMPKYLRCAFLSQADLFAGRWRDALNDVVAQPAPPRTLAPTGADEIAAKIAALL